MGVWFWRGLSGGQRLELELSPIWNALSVSFLAALLTSLAAVPIAVLAVRFPSKLSASLERLTYVGYALPGIVVALSLVFFGARYAPWLYQTRAMLVFAYAVLFLPQAVGNVRSTLLQVNPHLEEAARSLGRGRTRTLLEVTLPLVRSGLITGAAIVFSNQHERITRHAAPQPYRVQYARHAHLVMDHRGIFCAGRALRAAARFSVVAVGGHPLIARGRLGVPP